MDSKSGFAVIVAVPLARLAEESEPGVCKAAADRLPASCEPGGLGLSDEPRDHSWCSAWIQSRSSSLESLSCLQFSLRRQSCVARCSCAGRGGLAEALELLAEFFEAALPVCSAFLVKGLFG